MSVKKYDSTADEYFVIPGNANIEHKGIKSHWNTPFFRKLLTSEEAPNHLSGDLSKKSLSTILKSYQSTLNNIDLLTIQGESKFEKELEAVNHLNPTRMVKIL